jgi:DNA-binding YbaB/EbfC family protein
MAFNPRDLLKQVQELQAKMSQMQEKMREIRVTGTSGGEMVRVSSMESSPSRHHHRAEAVDPADIRMLEDLVRAAYTDALAKLKERLREETSALTGGMGLPPGMLGL